MQALFPETDPPEYHRTGEGIRTIFTGIGAPDDALLLMKWPTVQQPTSRCTFSTCIPVNRQSQYFANFSSSLLRFSFAPHSFL